MIKQEVINKTREYINNISSISNYMYASGEDIKVNKNIIGEKIYLVNIENKVKWVYADRQKAEYKARTIMREHISLIPKIEEYEVIE